MKNIFVIIVLFLQWSCSSSTNVMKTENGEQSERFKWFTVLESSTGKNEQPILTNIIKVTEDLYCVVEKEEKIPKNKMYGGMRGKLANCTYLNEHFQLWTVCDKQMGVMDQITTKNEKELDLKLSLKCVME